MTIVLDDLVEEEASDLANKVRCPFCPKTHAPSWEELKRHIFVTHLGVQFPESEPEFQASDELMTDASIGTDHDYIKIEEGLQEPTEENGNVGLEKLEKSSDVGENGQTQSETQGDATDSTKNSKSKKITRHVLQSKLLISKAGLLDVYIDDSKQEQVFVMMFCYHIFLFRGPVFNLFPCAYLLIVNCVNH